MTIYRRITADDIEPMAAFAIEGMGLGADDNVRLSMAKMRSVIAHFVNSRSDFHLVAFDNGRIVGGIAACVAEMMFFERCEAHVVLCQARGEPGVGAVLIKAMKAWADADMRIRRVQFPEELGARPGFARLLRRFGFNRVQRVCILEK